MITPWSNFDNVMIKQETVCSWYTIPSHVGVQFLSGTIPKSETKK